MVHDPKSDPKSSFGYNSFGDRSSDSHRGRILLVDDEPLVLEVLEGALGKEGYEVTTASDAQAALLLIERGAFDGIVCDVRLENLDGFDLLMIARKRNPTIAGVLITGAPTDFDAERANELAAAYLSKPIALGHLFMRLDELVRQSMALQNEEDEQERDAQQI